MGTWTDRDLEGVPSPCHLEVRARWACAASLSWTDASAPTRRILRMLRISLNRQRCQNIKRSVFSPWPSLWDSSPLSNGGGGGGGHDICPGFMFWDSRSPGRPQSFKPALTPCSRLARCDCGEGAGPQRRSWIVRYFVHRLRHGAAFLVIFISIFTCLCFYNITCTFIHVTIA